MIRRKKIKAAPKIGVPKKPDKTVTNAAAAEPSPGFTPTSDIPSFKVLPEEANVTQNESSNGLAAVTHQEEMPLISETIITEQNNTIGKCPANKLTEKIMEAVTISKSPLKNKPNKATSRKISVIPKVAICNAKYNESKPKPIADKNKKKYLERKEKFRKKLVEGNIEKENLTMFDLIFWNPSSNPMPEIKSRIRPVSEHENNADEEERAEDEGLEMENDTLNPVQEQSTETEPVELQKLPEPMNEENDENLILAPQVKIGPNGEIVVDEKSIMLRTTAAKNRDELLSKAEVIEETNDSSSYGKWSKRRKRSIEWTKKETARFYKALSSVGTDFTLMETVFAWRNRAELKMKFKKEERINRPLIDKALNEPYQFDFTIFDESDYDPEEDRKESKEAEKKKAKKKRELERKSRKFDADEHKVNKKKQRKLDMERRKSLRQRFKKRKKRVKTKKKCEKRKSVSQMIETTEVICEIILSDAEGRVSNRKRSLSVKLAPNVDTSTNITEQCDEIITSSGVCETSDLSESAEDAVESVLNEVLRNVAGDTQSTTSGEKTDKEAVSQCFPVSDVKENEDGSLYVDVQTDDGTTRVPVPTKLNPDTTGVVVIKTTLSDSPKGEVYHVYLMAPMKEK